VCPEARPRPPIPYANPLGSFVTPPTRAPARSWRSSRLLHERPRALLSILCPDTLTTEWRSFTPPAAHTTPTVRLRWRHVLTIDYCAWFRYEAIRDSGAPCPFIQWRDPDLDLAAGTDADARELIAPSSVRTDRFPDFRRAVAELALKPPEPDRPDPKGVVSVFVNSDLLDRSYGADVARWLEEHGFLVLEPPQSTQDAREEWETNLRYCDSLLLIYGQTRPTWVKTQILLSSKVPRETPFGVLSVCVGPPAVEPTRDKIAELGLRFAGIYYLRQEHSRGLNEAEMERFARHLRETHV
jgi:hypothetical protein